MAIPVTPKTSRKTSAMCWSFGMPVTNQARTSAATVATAIMVSTIHGPDLAFAAPGRGWGGESQVRSMDCAYHDCGGHRRRTRTRLVGDRHAEGPAHGRRLPTRLWSNGYRHRFLGSADLLPDDFVPSNLVISRS